MKKLAKGIVKYRFFVLLAVLVLIFLCLIGVNALKLNYDITSYLPEGTGTYDGMTYMRKNFGMEGDAMFGVQGINEAKAQEYVDYLGGLYGVHQVIWCNTMVDSIKGMLGDVLFEAMRDSLEETQAKLNAVFNPEEGTYLFMVQLTVNSSTDEAMAIVDAFEAKCRADGVTEFSEGGSTAITKKIFDTISNELWMYVVCGAVLVILILVLTSQSLLEPVIILLSLGVAVIVNLGTNFFFNSIGAGVSIYTFAISIILQLGLTMDYAIFLIHAYREERTRTIYPALAIERAIPKTFKTIMSSALTTIGGFLTLCIMQFSLGTDLALVLSKGVVFSMLAVIVLQPCILMLFAKALDKTTHKNFMPSFHKLGKFSVKGRIPLFVIAVILLIPALVGNIFASYTYMQIDKDTGEPTAIEGYVNGLANSIVMILPLSNGDVHDAMYEEIYAIEGATVKDEKGVPILGDDDEVLRVGKVQILGIYSMLPKGMDIDVVIRMSSSNPEMKKMLSSYVNSDNMTMVSVMVDNKTESDESLYALREVTALVEKYFPGQTTYVTGMIQSVEDLASLTQEDFKWVTVASFFVILVVLLFTLLSLKESVLLVVMVELGVLINIAMSFFLGSSINFMGYLIITAVQLGATVDYAVLLTTKFKANVKQMSTKNAAIKATSDAALPIITSTLILSSVCFGVAGITANAIISEMCLLIARGALISGMLCLFVLPGTLVLTRNWFRFRKKRNPLDKRLKTIKEENAMGRLRAMARAQLEENIRYEDETEPYQGLVSQIPIRIDRKRDEEKDDVVATEEEKQLTLFGVDAVDSLEYSKSKPQPRVSTDDELHQAVSDSDEVQETLFDSDIISDEDDKK